MDFDKDIGILRGEIVVPSVLCGSYYGFDYLIVLCRNMLSLTLFTRLIRAI